MYIRNICEYTQLYRNICIKFTLIFPIICLFLLKLTKVSRLFTFLNIIIYVHTCMYVRKFVCNFAYYYSLVFYYLPLPFINKFTRNNFCAKKLEIEN